MDTFSLHASMKRATPMILSCRMKRSMAFTLQMHACLSMILGTGHWARGGIRKKCCSHRQKPEDRGLLIQHIIFDITLASLEPRHDRTKGWQDIHT